MRLTVKYSLFAALATPNFFVRSSPNRRRLLPYDSNFERNFLLAFHTISKKHFIFSRSEFHPEDAVYVYILSKLIVRKEDGGLDGKMGRALLGRVGGENVVFGRY